MRARFLPFAAMLVLLAACSNAGESMTLPTLGNGKIIVQAYFDADNTLSYTVNDSLFTGARVSLLAAGGTDTLRVATTDAHGLATFDSVPIGTWRIVIDRRILNDSVGVVVGDSGIFRVLSRSDSATALRQVRLGYREVTIAQARALGAGHRVLIRGTVLSALQYFHDSSAFVSDPSGRIRITGARHRAGRTGNNIGDSVIVVGTTGADHGQPVLVGGLFSSLGTQPIPVPLAATVAQAHDAFGGTFDAGLVVVTGAKLIDSMPSGPDFVVRIADPANAAITTDVVIDSLLNIPHSVWRPGLNITVKGVLIPRGDGTWILKPRGGLDITLF